MTDLKSLLIDISKQDLIFLVSFCKEKNKGIIVFDQNNSWKYYISLNSYYKTKPKSGDFAIGVHVILNAFKENKLNDYFNIKIKEA